MLIELNYRGILEASFAFKSEYFAKKLRSSTGSLSKIYDPKGN